MHVIPLRPQLSKLSNYPTILRSQKNKFKRSDSNINGGKGLTGSVLFPETNC